MRAQTDPHPLIPSLSELPLKFLQRCKQPVNVSLIALTPVRHTGALTENRIVILGEGCTGTDTSIRYQISAPIPGTLHLYL